MEFRKFSNNYIVRIDKNEEVLEKITELCRTEGIKLGSITGLGASNKVVIGLFDTVEKQYHQKEITGPMEITSLVGNISTKDGETYLHCHINVCDADNHVWGGHLNYCNISATCELNITAVDGCVERKFSDEIGLNLYEFV